LAMRRMPLGEISAARQVAKWPPERPIMRRLSMASMEVGRK